MRYNDILESIGHTPLVEVARMSPSKGVRIFAKLEGYNPTGSLKDRIVRYMIADAEAKGELVPGKTLLEPTSGNTGISLAMVGLRRGYRVKVVMPENVSIERKQLLESYGAEVILSDGSLGTVGAITMAQQLVREGNYYMLFQYGNEANPRAHYETTAVEILEDMPRVDVFVAGLGTGGTLMGVGRRLKEHNPKTRVIAVVPEMGEQIQGLRSLEEGFIPPIVNLSLLDGRMAANSQMAFLTTKELLQKEGIFAGVSSGAVMHCAIRVAERMGRGNIVALLADGGWKYLSSELWTREVEELQGAMESKLWW